MSSTRQLTLEDAAREWHIARMERSLARWRASGLDQILPEEYARYYTTLEHLRAGGEYRVTRFDPMEAVRTGNLPGGAGQMVRDIAEGLAGISRRQDILNWRISRPKRRKVL